jgi:hypothetical protein
MSLGACAEWTGDWAAAEHWYRSASNLDVAVAERTRKKSYALIRLSHVLTRLSRHEEAVDAARSAQNLLSEQWPGNVETISAGLHTTQAMIGHGEKLLGENPDSARSLLDEISLLLRTAREDLSGFGPAAELELAWCDEQLDFVERLGQAIGQAI